MSRLSTDRLRLRPLELSDKALLYEWENTDEAQQSSLALNPLSSVMIESFIIRSSVDILEEGRISLLIECKAGEAIGYAQLLDYDSLNRRVALGLYIVPQFRRQGYASETVILLEDYAKRRLRCDMMYVTILAENEPSQKLFEHQGYARIATLPKWHYYDGRFIDLYYYQKWISLPEIQ